MDIPDRFILMPEIFAKINQNAVKYINDHSVLLNVVSDNFMMVCGCSASFLRAFLQRYLLGCNRDIDDFHVQKIKQLLFEQRGEHAQHPAHAERRDDGADTETFNAM